MSIKGNQLASQPESTFELIKNYLLSTAGGYNQRYIEKLSDPL